MKVIQFSIPVVHDKSVIIHEDKLPHFYPHLHSHTEAQIAWIQKGEGTLVAGNNMHSFQAGDIFFLGANQPHLFRSNEEYFTKGSEKSTQATMLFFNPNGALSPLFGLPEMKVLKNFLDQHLQGFKLPAIYNDEMGRLIVETKSASGADLLLHFFFILQFLSRITIKLEPLAWHTGHMGLSEAEGLRLSNIYNYILNNYSNDITLNDVADVANMTPHAFCRYFKKHTGHTFISFLNETRVIEACNKLISGMYEGISSVAYNCGFNSITNFNRVFKNVIGNSPRGYIDTYLSNVQLAG